MFKQNGLYVVLTNKWKTTEEDYMKQLKIFNYVTSATYEIIYIGIELDIKLDPRGYESESSMLLSSVIRNHDKK